MFKKILVPLDGSSLAEQSLGQAAEIARACGGEIDLVTVYEPSAHDSYGSATRDDPVWGEEHRRLESAATELEMVGSRPVTHTMLTGDPVDRICRRAVETEADLIVMTSHGRTGFNRAWFGSIADGIVRHSPVPVLMLRPLAGDARRAAARLLFDHILVPLDGSPLANDIIPLATALAVCHGARVTLLGVVQPVLSAVPSPANLFPYSFVPQDDSRTAALVASATEELTKAASRLEAAGTGPIAARVIVAGNVAKGVVDFALSHDVDLIAISTHGRGTSRLIVGSVADKVLRASGLPVLLRRAVSSDRVETDPSAGRETELAPIPA